MEKEKPLIIIIADRLGNNLANGCQVFSNALVTHLSQWFNITVVVNEPVTVELNVDIINSHDKEAIFDSIGHRNYALIYNLGATLFSCELTLDIFRFLKTVPVINHFQLILQEYAKKEGWTDDNAKNVGEIQETVAQLASRNIFPSFAELDIVISKKWEIKNAKNYVVPNAFIAEGGIEKKSKNDAATIIAAGRFSDYVKGADLLYNAFKGLLSAHPSAKLIVASNDDRFIELLQSVPSNSYQLLGWVTRRELFTAIQSADVMVVPSRYEPFGMVAIEAMAMATPVIAMNVGGLSEIIHHEHTGWITDWREGSLGLQIAMEAAVGNRTLTKQLGINAQKVVEMEYVMDRIGYLIKIHIDNVIEENRADKVVNFLKQKRATAAF